MLKRTALVTLLVVPTPLAIVSFARADVYRIEATPNRYVSEAVAVNDYGDYTVSVAQQNPQNSACGIEQAICYLTYYQSSGTSVYSATPPLLAIDPTPTPGPGCPPAPLPPNIQEEFCNNGHFLYGSSSPPIRGLFTGANIYADQIYPEAPDLDSVSILSANGNFLFDDAVDDTLVLALDVTDAPAPEPSSVALLATGLLGIAGVVKRRSL